MTLKKIGTIKYSTTPRVLPSVNGSPRMEVSGITGSLGGNLLGTEVLQSMTTFSAVLNLMDIGKESAQIQVLCLLLMDLLHILLLELELTQRMEGVHGKVLLILKLLLHHYQN